MSPSNARLLFGSLWIAGLSAVAWWEAETGRATGTTSLVGLLWFLALWEYYRMALGPESRPSGALRGALLVVGLPYVSLLWFLAVLRTGPGGLGLAFLVVAIAKVGDMAAYFVGSRWGRLKLAPTVSPKKTVEGGLAGLAASILVAGLSAMGVPRFGLSAAEGAVFGAAVAVAAQAGDLVESWIKRRFGVKDSGSWPGLGGALDTIDSLLLAAPAACWLYPMLAH